jgi:hypothetical protein
MQLQSRGSDRHVVDAQSASDVVVLFLQAAVLAALARTTLQM